MNARQTDDLFLLVREPIAPQALVRQARAAEDGAIVTFDGFVRNESHGRRTLYLDYEAYETMALAKMREIGTQLHRQFAIDPCKHVFRLPQQGILAVGLIPL